MVDPDDLADVGPTDVKPSDFLKKFEKNAKRRKELLKQLSNRKFVEQIDEEKRVPKDTNLLFEYFSEGGEVLMVKYANHPFFQSLDSIEEMLKTKLDEDELSAAELENAYHELRILWDILLSTLVVTLATVSPNDVQQKIIDKVLSRWGQLICDKVEKHNERSDEE